MPPRSHFPFIGLLSSLLAALLAVPLLGTVAHADPSDPVDAGVPAGVAVDIDDDLPGSTAGDTDGDSARETAEQALATVQEIVETAPSGAPATEGADLTMALRDLAVAQEDLPSDLQDEAARLLARPATAHRPPDPNGIECRPGSGLPCYTAPEATPACNSVICVHRVESTADAASFGWASDVLDVITHVRQRYIEAGYRTPLNDGDGVFDVYLADLGARGLYGYCTTDTRVSVHAGAPAYCVLDNNYAEYGPVPGPMGNLKVTAAHEYFHAVQFAYDVLEESWLLEATATWAEDEIYDDINDNRQYLKAGPLGMPAQSMDHRRGLAPYGAWIFFKFLGERFPQAHGGMPVIVRDIWTLAAGAPTARQAIGVALAARGTDLRTQFGLFAAANRRPAQHYSEGASYPRANLWRRLKMTNARRSFSDRIEINHLASRTVRLKSKVSGKARVRIHVDLPKRKKGSYVVVTLKKKGKAPITTIVKLNRKGNKTKGFAFGKKVRWVEITMANAGKKDARASISARVVR